MSFIVSFVTFVGSFKIVKDRDDYTRFGLFLHRGLELYIHTLFNFIDFLKFMAILFLLLFCERMHFGAYDLSEIVGFQRQFFH